MAEPGHECRHMGMPVLASGISQQKSILLHNGREVVPVAPGSGNLTEVQAKFGPVPEIFLRQVRKSRIRARLLPPPTHQLVQWHQLAQWLSPTCGCTHSLAHARACTHARAVCANGTRHPRQMRGRALRPTSFLSPPPSTSFNSSHTLFNSSHTLTRGCTHTRTLAPAHTRVQCVPTAQGGRRGFVEERCGPQASGQDHRICWHYCERHIQV